MNKHGDVSKDIDKEEIKDQKEIDPSLYLQS